jgi:hypothetical protein
VSRIQVGDYVKFDFGYGSGAGFVTRRRSSVSRNRRYRFRVVPCGDVFGVDVMASELSKMPSNQRVDAGPRHL